MSKRSTGLITPATFATLREACRPTQNETGVYLGRSLRAVQQWEAGDRSIPDDAAARLIALDGLIRDQVSAIVLPLMAGPPVVIELIRYETDETYAGTPEAQAGLPRLSHHAMLWRAIDAITRLGHQYRVEWAEDAGKAGE